MNPVKTILLGILLLVKIASFGQISKPQDFIYNTKDVIINGGCQSAQVKSYSSLYGNCDTIFSFNTSTGFPLGIAWDGQYLWYSSYQNGIIYKIDTLGNYIDSIATPMDISGLEFNGINLYGINEQSAMLFIFNISNGTFITHSLPTAFPLDPNLWGTTFGEGYLWVSEYCVSYDTLSRIYKIDPITIGVIDTIFVHSNILGIKWINNLLYGINTNSQMIFKINPLNGSLIDSSNWCIPLPYDFTVENNYLWNISGRFDYGGMQKIYKINSDFVGLSTSIFKNENNNSQLLCIYPNPSNNEITLEIKQNIESSGYSCEIINLNGQIIRYVKLTNQKTKINIEELKSGVYIVKIKSDSEIMIEKIIKE